jgi:hypothetical protein
MSEVIRCRLTVQVGSQQHRPGVRDAASCGFKYRGYTRDEDARLGALCCSTGSSVASSGKARDRENGVPRDAQG